MATYLKGLSLREIRDLFVLNGVGVDGKVAGLVGNMRANERQIAGLRGAEIAGCDVLEVGSGQRSPYRYFFASRNRYVGIDIEPPDERNALLAFAADLRNHGATRAIKSLGRRALGVDRRFERAMLAELGIERLGGTVLCMDAERMTFEDQSMDVVVSTSVFEHLPAPRRVMSEIARVLRPGGVAHVITHIFTSESGMHDTRIFVGDRDRIPLWAHLRPQHRDKVSANSYLNEMRLQEYREAFDATWPGATHLLYAHDPPERLAELRALRASGELLDYDDEELLTEVLCTVWRKPGPAPAEGDVPT